LPALVEVPGKHGTVCRQTELALRQGISFSRVFLCRLFPAWLYLSSVRI